ncbi:hypothetical protein HR060_17170 [Catenovulum sp. SM1970]|uniref:hypothetical protein n=1 Tax=Marinifaba aquimaris TaxID=2741323 RepID=UPI0015736B15|nr:hypothetical protein [Marinifaba aquimaris]NTS78577.1 hypothetical protein [Marinifaba aquimaris]
MLSKLVVLLAASSLFFSSLVSAKYQINATIEGDVLKDYYAFLQGRDPLSIKNFSGEQSRRDVVEAILLQQAIHLGGEDVKFVMVPGHYDSRNLVLLKKGRLLLGMDSVWWRDAENLLPDVLISSPLIPEGENISGIYVKPTNSKALNSQSLAQLQQLVAVSSRFWKTDWQAITSLNPKKQVHELEWGGMLSHIFFDNADYTLAPFQATPDLSFQTGKGILVPIPNIKVLLKGSRHYVISRGHPMGEKTYKAMEKGLTIMRERGWIKKAYQESGFFNPKVADWKIINPS